VPRLELADIEPLRGGTREDALAMAGALARESSHPLARALVDAARQSVPFKQAGHVQAVAGAGLRGTVDGRALRLGRADFALDGSQAGPDDAVLLADDVGAIARFHLAERPRHDAQATLDALRNDGIASCVASGDAPERVAALAALLGIGDWRARQSPADKLARLRELRSEGRVVLAVGDGSNDAPILAGADVSAALAGGTGLAQAQADLLLMDDRLDGLVRARAVARDVQRIVAQGRRWSLVYNLCAAPFAAFGFVPPWLAGIGMSLSSLAVVLNALRAGRDGNEAREELRA
jgi:Cu2+-exporting ATPase